MSLYAGGSWQAPGLLTLLLAWALPLRALWWTQIWVDRAQYPALGVLMNALYAGPFGIALFLAGAWLQSSLWMQVSLFTSPLQRSTRWIENRFSARL